MPAFRNDLGPKIGWLGGFLGASLWLVILAAVHLVNRDLWGGLLGLFFYLVCLGCIFSLRPWKYPQTPLWKLYTATLAPLLVAAGWFYWREYPLNLSFSGILRAVSLLTVLFLPVILHGRKTWNHLQG
jgi:hypothetical protein